MSQTIRNRRKKLIRKHLVCQQCGISYDKSPEGLCYVADELDDRPEPKKCFCSDSCVRKWRDQHEILAKNKVRYFGTSAGYGIAVRDGEIIERLPMQSAVYWYPLS